MIPILMAADKNTFYCLSTDKAERNSVFKVNFATGDKNLVYENYGEVTINIDPDSIYTGALGAAEFARRAGEDRTEGAPA